MKLDYGSGYNPVKGFKSSDFVSGNYDYFIKDCRVDCEDETFTAIHCKNVVHHIPDLDKLFREFNRILKPKGKVLVCDCRKEAYFVNRVYDTIWYRFVNKRYDIKTYGHRDFAAIGRKYLRCVGTGKDGIREFALFVKRG